MVVPREWIFLLVLASARDEQLSAPPLPERARRAHERVVQNPTKDACAGRLAALRDLIDSGDHSAALDLSFALDELRASSEAALPASCRADTTFVGAADITVAVRTPERRDRGAAAERVTKVHLHHADGSVTHHPYRGAPRAPARREAVVGAVVDGAFVAAAPSARVPRAGRRPAVSRVADKYTKSVVGEKTMLISVICPSMTDASTANDCATAYDYELIKTDHGGDVLAYLAVVVGYAQAFFTANSWGNLTFAVDYTPVLEVAYRQDECKDSEFLDWGGSGYDGDPGAFDILAAHASLAAGFDREAYDFNVVVTPYCAGAGISGQAFVGKEGSYLNPNGYDYDPSLVHELGHNFGAYHASYEDTNGNIVEYGEVPQRRKVERNELGGTERARR